MGKYFNSAVITPLVKASVQHAAFTEGDIVFDWTSFDIPRGAARLLGATITYRHNKVASQAGTLDLVFAKDGGNNTALTSLGTGNALLGATNYANTDIIGFLPGKLTDMPGEGVLATAAAYQTSTAIDSPIVLEPLATNTASGVNVGYDRYYVAGLSSGALDLRSLVAFDDDIDVSGEDGTLTDLDGTAPNVVFAAGDILHAEDDIIIGEVASVTANNIVLKFDGSTSTNHAVVAGNQSYTVPADIAAWRVQNGAGAAGDLANNELVYNIYPIRIFLHFEN